MKGVDIADAAINRYIYQHKHYRWTMVNVPQQSKILTGSFPSLVKHECCECLETVAQYSQRR
jgi:hypothetical protein